MIKETNIRSLAKGISWRILASLTTMGIVYALFGNLTLAAATGAFEIVAKIILYWGHEKIWQKIDWGKKRIEPFNIWFIGLPLSGKTTIADLVYKEIEKMKLPVERIDSRDIRDFIPEIGFERNDRIRHIKRVVFLVRMLQKNYISSVCSFVAPYEEMRTFIKKHTKNPIIVYLKASINTCKKRDYKGMYEKALRGEIKNFTGISDVFEEPKNIDLVINTENISPEQAKDRTIRFIKRQLLKKL